jgi:hypothetical protein
MEKSLVESLIVTQLVKEFAVIEPHPEPVESNPHLHDYVPT